MRIKSEKSLAALMEEHLVSEVAPVSAKAALQTMLRNDTTVSLGDTQLHCAGAHGRRCATQDVCPGQPAIEINRALQGNICAARSLKAMTSDTGR